MAEEEVVFDPQPDITAFELAEILRRVLQMTRERYTMRWEAMPEGLRRHFKLVTQR